MGSGLYVLAYARPAFLAGQVQMVEYLQMEQYLLQRPHDLPQAFFHRLIRCENALHHALVIVHRLGQSQDLSAPETSDNSLGKKRAEWASVHANGSLLRNDQAYIFHQVPRDWLRSTLILDTC